MLADPHRMAEFNAWANTRLHRACEALSSGEFTRDRQAFFGSIQGTLNHILLVDLLYRERLEGRPGEFESLAEILHSELTTLTTAQSRSDAYYVDLTANMDAEALDAPVGFTTLLEEAEYWEVSRRLYLTNLFQHQIHHRGQAHNMLSQAGIDPPPIGFIEFEVERGERIVRRKA